MGKIVKQLPGESRLMVLLRAEVRLAKDELFAEYLDARTGKSYSVTVYLPFAPEDLLKNEPISIHEFIKKTSDEHWEVIGYKNIGVKVID